MQPLASDVWKGPLPPLGAGLARPRIGIAGISIESSTFSPHISGDEAFRIRTGDDLMAYYPFLDEGWELRDVAEWVPLYHGRSLPGGAVAPETYERMKAAILDGIATQGPFDGFFFDIHGAMSVVGMDDAEADLAVAVREALGPDTLVSTSMDLHGNVSRTLLDQVDLLTCYRMAPHEDVWNTKERAVHNLLVCLRSTTDVVARRPLKAWLQVPVLLPGEKTSTRLDPAKALYDRLPAIESREGILDASIWVGYAWADEPRCQAAVVVLGDDAEAIAAAAEELARGYWDARKDFVFVGPTATFADAMDTALAQEAPRPFVVSDSGDNPTAGGAGDVSWSLSQLLAHRDLRGPGRIVLHASTFDPAAVALAWDAGVGAEVELSVGGNVDSRTAPPALLRGEVFSLTDGDPVAGRQAVIRAGSVYAILTERRKPFHHLADFRTLGVEPAEADVVVVKIGYLEPELFALAQGWILALTPGGVDQDLLRLGHHRLAPGVFPFEPDVEPTLNAVVTRRK